MNLQEIISLSQAGYTKEEIMQLSSIEQPVPTPVPASVPVTPAPASVPVTPVPAPVPASVPVTPAPASVPVTPVPAETKDPVNTDLAFQAFLQKIAGVSSSIDVPPTHTMQDKLSKHFETLIVGEKKE